MPRSTGHSRLPSSPAWVFPVWRPGRTLNQPNRRVRTRTHGGVTGKAREGSPMSILDRKSWEVPADGKDRAGSSTRWRTGVR